MADKMVALPPSITQQAASQKRETLALLAILAQFAFPDTYTSGQLEMNLATAFASVAQLSMADITGWLSSINAPVSSLASIIGDLQSLHDTLMSENDSGSCQLLAVNRQDMLRVYLGPQQEAILSQTAAPCYLLRVGYSVDEGFAYYYINLPALDTQQVKLTWNSVIAAGIADAIAIAPPKPPVDVDAASTALHIMSQALATATSAHATALHALGLATE